MCFKKKTMEDIVKECEEIFANYKDITLCFTGHRPQKLPWRYNEQDPRCVKMKEDLRKEIVLAIHNGYIYFICGMAIGFDTICAEMILELKKEYPQIKLICALPSKDQDAKWYPRDKQRYKEILKQADKIHCQYEKWQEGCELERNDFMLSNSSMCIALYNGLGGGTGYTVKRAKEQGLNVKIIKP